MILAALTVAATLTAQQSIRLTSEKQGKENQVSVENVKVERTEEKILVSMDFILDSLDVPSNRYRAFTPVIRSKDGMQTQRLKTLIVSGRLQAIVFERDGSIAGIQRKMHIPDDPAYYEKFYFTPGDQGFQPIETSVGRLGVQVCWDQWYPEGARLMALRGAELLIYPTAIGYDSSDTPEEQERQREAWTTVQRGHAVANGLPVVTVNRVGHEPAPDGQTHGIQFWGSSFVCGPQGELLYRAPKEEETNAVVDIDLRRSEQVRRWWPFLRDRRIEEFDGLTKRYLA